MCEVIPPECLPAPLPGDPRGQACVSRVPRRAVLAGLGGVLLAACMPVRGMRRRTVEAQVVAPRSRPQPPYRIIRRAAWGAEPLKPNHDPMARISKITLHHTAEIAGMATRTDADLVKGVQDFHRNQRGWADIGYHWVIGQDANVYEGRALDVQGAHAGAGHNGENLGISVIGDFRQGLPTQTVLRTVDLFLRAQMRRYEIGADAVFGHRDFKATACPGDALYGWLAGFKAS